MDEYQLVTQGEVFYLTELLAKLEGIERGPAGNTSLTAAVTIAREWTDRPDRRRPGDRIHRRRQTPQPQLSFARENGIEVRLGDPADNKPGERIVIPERLDQVRGRVQDMDKLRISY